MTGQPSFADPAALEQAARETPATVTPLMLERLLEHEDFEEKGELPGPAKHRVTVWGPRASTRYPELTYCNVAITHTSPVATAANIQAVLGALHRFRAWRLRNPQANL